MDPICNAIQRNGLRCTARHNDGSGRCGRHGGLARRVFNRITRQERPPNKFLSCARTTDTDCFVCLSKVTEAMVLPCCKQTACQDCLRNWLHNNLTCPHCRCNLYETHATLTVV